MPITDAELGELQMTREEWDEWVRVNDEFNNAMIEFEKTLPPPPKCHFTYMSFEVADNGNGGQVEYWECQHCGHTIEAGYINLNAN